MPDSPQPDFEAEGLLEGLEGEQREARLALLRDLAADGVGLEELRAAVRAGRLALLPVERAIAGGGPRYSVREIAEASGVELGVLQRYLTALGLPNPPADERVLTEADLESARRVKAFREVGLPEEGMLQVARTIGMSTARIAQANRELIRDTLVHPGDSERDLAIRFATAARHLIPLVAPTLAYAMQTHLLTQIRRDVIGAGELAAGELGENLAAEELGQVAGRLEEMASAVAAPPVQLVKLIGDAAMLVADEPAALLGVALRLVEAADEEGEQFPQLRAGAAWGPTVGQAGDYFGRTVNLASRITAVARPGSVLVSEEMKDAERQRFHFSFAGERRLKGIDDRVKLYRARREPKEERG